MKKFLKSYWLILICIVCLILSLYAHNWVAAVWTLTAIAWMKVSIVKDEYIEALKDHIEILRGIDNRRPK